MKTYSQISQYGVKKSKSKGVKKKHISRTKLCWVLYRTTIITTTKILRIFAEKQLLIQLHIQKKMLNQHNMNICRKTTIGTISRLKRY